MGQSSLSAALTKETEVGTNFLREDSFQKHTTDYMPSDLSKNYSWVETDDLGLVMFLNEYFLESLGEVNIC